MTRKDFLKNIATFSIATPFMASLLSSCSKEEIELFNDIPVNFDGKVIVIGAGAAGLIAGHTLQQKGIDFQIIEASSIYGGRMKKFTGFADFPMDLGAEWIHTDPSILTKLANDPSANDTIDIISYSPETISVYKNGKLRRRNIFSHFYGEYKFKKTTWYGFFEEYIVPKISDRIIYNSPITAIDYTGDQVVVTNQAGDTFTADKILVTVPLTILQDEFITFNPPLPSNKVTAMNNVDVPPGFKAFIEFEEQFYPDLTSIGGLAAGFDTLYYNAAFRKEANSHVLALFSVSEESSRYTDLNDDDVFALIMEELDEIFDGKATQFYKNHVIQNWSKEPFIRGSYSHYNSYSDMDVIAESLAGKVFFAGEALHPEASSTVHGAGESGFNAVAEMLS